MIYFDRQFQQTCQVNDLCQNVVAFNYNQIEKRGGVYIVIIELLRMKMNRLYRSYNCYHARLEGDRSWVHFTVMSIQRLENWYLLLLCRSRQH
jgi:hypothetical protein